MVTQLWKYARSSPEGLIRICALAVTALAVLALLVMAAVTLA
jgi:hypothetical protein